MCIFLEELYLNETTFNCKTVLEDFQVETETELENMLVEQSKTIPCIKCGKEFPIEELNFDSGDPVCKNCR